MAIESDYLIWDSVVVKGACTVHDITGLEKSYKLRADAPLGEVFTKGASCQLVDVNPKGAVIPDNLLNIDMAIIVSEKLADFLRSQNLNDVEYLPFGMVDAKNTTIPGTLIMVHPVNNPDCLDIQACKPTYETIFPDRIDTVENIVFSTDPKRDLFRAKGYAEHFFVSRKLAKTIHEGGFTGVRFWEITGYIEHNQQLAFDAPSKEASSISSGSKKATYDVPPKECEEWVEGIKKGAMVNGQTFIPAWGEDEWLESYDEDDSAAFDPHRYIALGCNGSSDYWLLDLADGNVVYYAHESAYNETNFDKVSKDWQSFAAQLKKG